MNAVKLSLAIIVLALGAVLVLAVVGPMAVQDRVNTATGNGDTAIDNVKESLDNLNDTIEESEFGQWVEEIDNSTN